MNRLPLVYAEIIILLFVVMVAVHWARRAFRQPVKSPPGQHVEPAEGMVNAFDIVERLYHWSLFVVTGLLVLTGVTLFVPGTFDYLLSSFGVTSTAGLLLWHTDLVWALLGLIVVHIVWDVVVARGWWNIWIGVKDIKDTGVRAKNFFGLTSQYSKPGKYDIFMKTLHWGMVVSLVATGITGLFLWNPYGLLSTISASTEYLFRILHDVFAFLFLGLVIGHIYFAVIPVNWPVLRAIFTGNISKEAYLNEYDAKRWSLTKRSKVPKEKSKPTKPEATPEPSDKGNRCQPATVSGSALTGGSCRVISTQTRNHMSAMTRAELGIASGFVASVFMALGIIVVTSLNLLNVPWFSVVGSIFGSSGPSYEVAINGLIWFLAVGVIGGFGICIRIYSVYGEQGTWIRSRGL